MDTAIKPWVAIVISGDKADIHFFDTHAGAVDLAIAWPELTVIVCNAIAVFGPKSGVGIDDSVELRKNVV